MTIHSSGGAARIAAHDARLIESGGLRITVRFPAHHAAILRDLAARLGVSNTAAVLAAIEAAAKTRVRAR